MRLFAPLGTENVDVGRRACTLGSTRARPAGRGGAHRPTLIFTGGRGHAAVSPPPRPPTPFRGRAKNGGVRSVRAADGYRWRIVYEWTRRRRATHTEPASVVRGPFALREVEVSTCTYLSVFRRSSVRRRPRSFVLVLSLFFSAIH